MNLTALLHAAAKRDTANENRGRIVVELRFALGDPPVSETRLGEDQTRPGGVVVQLAAELKHGDPEPLAGTRGPRVPGGIQQLVMAEQSPTIRHECFEESHLDRPEDHGFTAPRHAASGKIDLEVTCSMRGVGSRRRRHAEDAPGPGPTAPPPRPA